MVGYHGLSWRLSSQRQSGMRGSMSQTGLPIAPARWATAVSTVMMRSRLSISAAVFRRNRSNLWSNQSVESPAGVSRRLRGGGAFLQAVKRGVLACGQRSAGRPASSSDFGRWYVRGGRPRRGRRGGGCHRGQIASPSGAASSGSDFK